MTTAQLPSSWAHDVLNCMVRADQGPLGTYVRRFSSKIFPGAAPEAFMGFAANGISDFRNCDGSQSDNAPGSRFHELGWFGTTGGPRSGPAPGPTPSSDNNWEREHARPDVVNALGRPAVMGDGEWRQHVEDQVAVGLSDLKYSLGDLSRLLDTRIRPTDIGSMWSVALAFAAWSAGAGSRTASHFNRYADQLAAVPESIRWAQLLYVAAQDALAGNIPDASYYDHANRFYTFTRTQQKLEMGSQLAQHQGGDVDWFYFGDPASVVIEEQAIANAANHQRTPGSFSLAPPKAPILGGIGTAAAVAGIGAVLAGGGYYAWRLGKKHQQEGR